MGTTVLDPGVARIAGVHIYAQCLRNVPGGVALLVINANQESAAEVSLPTQSERYTLTSHELQGRDAQLNGATLSLGPDDALPALKGIMAAAGTDTLPPVSITFFTLRDANNSTCK